MGLLDEIKSIEKTRITAEYIATMKKQFLDMFAESWYGKIRTNILTEAKKSNKKNIEGRIDTDEFTNTKNLSISFRDDGGHCYRDIGSIYDDNKKMIGRFNYSSRHELNSKMENYIRVSVVLDKPVSNIDELKTWGVSVNGGEKETYIIWTINLKHLEEEHGFFGLKRKISFSDDFKYIENKMQELAKKDNVKIKKEIKIEQYCRKDANDWPTYGKPIYTSDEIIVRAKDSIGIPYFRYEFQIS